MTTGPLHWELLLRARALDNQIYVAGCAPARDPTTEYVAWGHSALVDPMGRVVASTKEKEDIVYGTMDSVTIAEARKAIPTSLQRRFDVYPDISTTYAYFYSKKALSHLKERQGIGRKIRLENVLAWNPKRSQTGVHSASRTRSWQQSLCTRPFSLASQPPTQKTNPNFPKWKDHTNPFVTHHLRNLSHLQTWKRF